MLHNRILFLIMVCLILSGYLVIDYIFTNRGLVTGWIIAMVFMDLLLL